MKKAVMFFGLLLFFLCACFNGLSLAHNISYATNKNDITNIEYNFCIDGQMFNFNSHQVLDKINISQFQKELIKSKKRTEILEKIKPLNLSIKEMVDYAFPEVFYMLEKINQKVNIKPQCDDIQVVLNKCEIKIKEGQDGQFLNLENFYKEFYKQAIVSTNKISINLKTQKHTLKNNLKNDYVEKSCFSTSFKTSSNERKNNIKKAMSAFDGVVLEEGEVLSFNKTTGLRTKENGYLPAKIISGGTFVEGFGGGVCQVSTTLYNACLLAGLEIVEVHSHSLPVGYVEPSFDAMVNTGSSDLVIKNNSGGKLIFTTSTDCDECKFKIFGKKNKFKITRFSEKLSTIKPEADIVETNPSKYQITNLEIGEEKRLSFAKEGYKSNGYLNYFDDNGNLIKTKKIRENTYAPTKGVTVKREN